MESKRSAGDGSYLSIEAFCSSVGEPGGNVCEDPLEVTADGARQLAEWPQSRARRPVDPLEEFASGDVDLAPIEDRSEALLPREVRRFGGYKEDGRGEVSAQQRDFRCPPYRMS